MIFRAQFFELSEPTPLPSSDGGEEVKTEGKEEKDEACLCEEKGREIWGEAN